MKVRIEIFEDDGTEKASIQFNGKDWKECVTSFIHSIDGTKPPSNIPSSEMPIQQAPPIAQPSVQQQVPPYPQLQYNSYPPIQQPVFYYPQPVQYRPQPTTQSTNHQPLQQAIFPGNQPPLPQQYAAQPVVPLQSQAQACQSPLPQQYAAQPIVPLQSQACQPPLPQQYAAQPVVPLQSQAQACQPHISLQNKINDTTLTISERLELFLKFEYPHVWFTSQEIQGHYEQVYGFIKLSTVSTYLSRMYRKNILQRRGNRTQREYMYICDELDTTPANNIIASGVNGIMQ